MTCDFITEHEGRFCFVEGTGNRSRAAEADGTFLASKKPPPGLAERCHDIWGSTNQKTKRGNCWTFSFILNKTLFSAFNLDHAPAAYTKEQKPLWFHFSGNFVLLGKKQTNSTCCLPSSYQGNKLQRDVITFLYKAEQLIDKVVSGKVSRHGLTQKKILSKDIRLNKEGRESRHTLTSSLEGGTNQQKHTPLDQIQHRHTHTHTGAAVSWDYATFISTVYSPVTNTVDF